jgi:hypothetical protein
MEAKEPWNDSTKKMIERINNVPVSKEELLELVDETEQLDPEERCYESHLVTLIRLQHGNHEKVSAIMFRMEALARLLAQEGATGWTLPLPNGGLLTQEPVFAAAAIQPLIEQNGDVAFDREEFFQKVLELAELDEIG